MKLPRPHMLKSDDARQDVFDEWMIYLAAEIREKDPRRDEQIGYKFFGRKMKVFGCKQEKSWRVKRRIPFDI